jgi:hypothetical protein
LKRKKKKDFACKEKELYKEERKRKEKRRRKEEEKREICAVMLSKSTEKEIKSKFK